MIMTKRHIITELLYRTGHN